MTKLDYEGLSETALARLGSTADMPPERRYSGERFWFTLWYGETRPFPSFEDWLQKQPTTDKD